MRGEFLPFFRQIDQPTARGKFLARVFGIFSEEIVRIWAADPRSPYEDLGRPTLLRPEEKRGCTLDFALRSRETGRTYVAELKCEIEYQDYRYLVLEDVAQLRHHVKPAFESFLKLARRQGQCSVTVAGRKQDVEGAILMWGAATPAGREAVERETGIYTVITMEDVVADLQEWRSKRYFDFLDQRQSWADNLFIALGGAGRDAA